jgi:beta-lactamase superfamily II metal-dependent hydrolase
MTGLLNIPAMKTANGKQESWQNGGNSNYVVTIANTTKEEYLSYQELLTEYGFEKCAENAEGIGGTVFSATFTRGEMVLTVVYYALEQKTSISFYVGPVSKHLNYKEEYVAQNVPGAKTKMHMVELWRFGNSFVFQLKNGHFIISDGGTWVDLPYLLDYLETLVPEGELPIVDAWFITHAHGDHCGALMGFLDNTEWMKRLYVNGVYFSEPNDWVQSKCGGDLQIPKMKWATKWLIREDGEYCEFYRPQTGQRYYFNDLTIDVLLCQEQVPVEDYHGDLNTSSTVTVITVEGQKLFFSGDIHQEGLRFIIRNYTKEYLTLDFFTLNHHGFNTCNEFTDYATVKVGLLTLQHTLPIRMIRETKRMIAKMEETMMWGEGTKVLTFPYELGTVETMPKTEWKYDRTVERVLQPNIYTFPGRRLKGFIFEADRVILSEDGLKEGVHELLSFLKENEVHMSAYSVDKTTEVLKADLKKQGVDTYFELIMGADVLDKNDPYMDAGYKSEAAFKLDHIHKYTFVCQTYETVDSVVKDGFRTFVITDGKALRPEMELKCWHSRDSLLDFFKFFEEKKTKFE